MRGFDMPPEKARAQMVGSRRGARKPTMRKAPRRVHCISLPGLGPTDARLMGRVALVVAIGMGLLWGVTWLYGHFRWGWGIG